MLAAHLLRARSRRPARLALLLPPGRGARPRRRTRCSTCSTALVLAGGADLDPATYGAEPAPGDASGTWPERDRFELALARRALERGHAGARHLPRDAAPERRLRRHARPAPPRRSAATTTSTRPARSPTTRCGSSPARSPARAAGRRADRGPVAPPPGGRRAGRGAGGERLVGAGDDLVEAIELPGPPFALGRPLARRGGRRAAAWSARSCDAARRGGGRSVIEVVEPATEQVMAEVPRAGRRGDRRRGRRGEGGLPGLAGGRARRPGRAAASPRRRARATEPASWRRSRRATPASRSPTPAARSRWWSNASATTPAPRSGCSARRSRSPAAST